MKKKWLFLCLVFCLFAVTACGKEKKPEHGKAYDIYVMNKEETKVFANSYTTESVEQNELIQELLGQLSQTPDKLEYKAPISGSFKLLDYSVSEGQLILNFDQNYINQSITTETLTRAAIVRTMTQIKGIDYVSFHVNSEPLKDNMGGVIGIMSAHMFIDNSGNEINSLEKVKIRLYFADEKGNRLVETIRTLVYNTNISTEKLVVEQLIKGPSEQVKGNAFPTINPATKINSISVKDGTCYVNLNENFLTQTYNVTSDVTIYSIANSLVELPNVNKVQILINGETNVMYRENTSLSVPFERNLDLVGSGN